MATDLLRGMIEQFSESASLAREVAEQTYGTGHLDLVLAVGYLFQAVTQRQSGRLSRQALSGTAVRIPAHHGIGGQCGLTQAQLTRCGGIRGCVVMEELGPRLIS